MGTEAGVEVEIPLREAELAGTLTLPDRAVGMVLFAHGSGSSRFSPRNRWVAEKLHERGLGTLLFDLLTADEERVDAIDAHLRFDIPFLARRLVAVTDWVGRDARTRGMPIGYFGASTGAAAALIAAAERRDRVAAVVSRGGRPDLAHNYLPKVAAPTLLIVGGADVQVLVLNREAAAQMRAPCKLAIVPRATHLFEERGALDEVARLAGDFLVQHLVAARREAPRAEDIRG